MPEPTSIQWTPELFQEFKEAYELATCSGSEIFKFAGCQFYTPYAKYLIEYLEGLFREMV